MRGGDPRSRRIAVVPYALLAPAGSLGDPALAARLAALRERLVAEGWGLLQAPPAEMDEQAASAALDALADQVADYIRNGYAVAAFPVEGLAGGGVFGDRLASPGEAAATGAKPVRPTGATE
jgi:hypothetical protein